MIALSAWPGASAFHLTNPAAIARFLDPLVHKYLRWVASHKTKSMEENNAKQRNKVKSGGLAWPYIHRVFAALWLPRTSDSDPQCIVRGLPNFIRYMIRQIAEACFGEKSS